MRTIRAGDGEVGGVAGEPAGDHRARQRRLDRRLFGASLEHPADQPDVDRFGLQRPPTGCLDPLRAPLLDQSEQGVDLAHLRPRQRDVQQRRGVDTDRLAVVGGHPSQPIQIAHRVDRGVRGQVVGVGRHVGRELLAGMDLDSCPRAKIRTSAAVGADVDTGADQVPRHRVERLGHLDVMIPVHLRRHVDRHVVALRRCRQQPGLLLDGEHLDRSALGGAMDPQPGPFPAPPLGPPLGVGEIDERLPGEERVAHERHGPLHPWLVLRATHPGRIDLEPAALGVLDERLVQPWRQRIGVVDDGRQVVGDHRGEHAAEERPRRFEPVDHVLGGLAERQPHEAVPASSRP